MEKKARLIATEAESRIRKKELEELEVAKAIQKKNYNFVQVEKSAFKELRSLIDISPVAARVLMLLAEKMNRQNALVCSYATLTTITKLGRTTLHKAIKLLKNGNWIQVVKIGTVNAYLINSNVFWQSYGNKKHTVFNATVIASSDEQTDSIENWENIKLRHVPVLEKNEDLLLSGNEPPPPYQTEFDV